VTTRQALAFIERHGIVLQAARGPVPSLAVEIAGGPIRGSWWGHPKGREIFRITQAVSDSPDVLVCKLIDGKITYVHRRLWPALVKMASRFPKNRLARVREEHTASGKHVVRTEPFPRWVPEEARVESEKITVEDAEFSLSLWERAAPRSASPTGRSLK
jgi:hypothetical protein